MTRFINAYEKDCPGFTLNYTSSGSGAGVSEFLGGQTDFGGSDSPSARRRAKLSGRGNVAGAVTPGIFPPYSDLWR